MIQQVKVEDAYEQLPYDPKRVMREDNYHETGYTIPEGARVPAWSSKPGSQFQAAPWHKTCEEEYPPEALTTYNPDHCKFRSPRNKSLLQKDQAKEERNMKMLQKQARDGNAEKQKNKRLRRVSKPSAEGDDHPALTKKWRRDDSDTDEPDVKGSSTTYDHSSRNNYIVTRQSKSY